MRLDLANSSMVLASQSLYHLYCFRETKLTLFNVTGVSLIKASFCWTVGNKVDSVNGSDNFSINYTEHSFPTMVTLVINNVDIVYR